MNSQVHSVVFVIALLLAVPASGQVRIELRSEVEIEAEEIRLGDVARISDNSGRSSAELQQLDLSQMQPDADSVVIRPSLVAIRLQLGGWSRDSFRIVGAESVRVTRRSAMPVMDSDIETAAARTMQATLNVPPDEVRVRMTSPFMESMPKLLQQDDNLRVEVLPPLNSRSGTVALTVRLWRGSRLVQTRTGRFEVLRRQQVAVTRSSIPRNHVITARDFQLEQRFLAAPADQLEEDQVLGRQVRANLTAGQMLSLRDLQPRTKRLDQQVIRARDNVRITAVRGRLRVQLTAAEAMQSGRVGQAIRVRNLKSREIVTGRVTAPGQVEVRL